MAGSGKSSTYVKSFFAESVQAAMENARQELGADALLLNSREAPPEARHLGDFEAVFAACSEPLFHAPPAVDDGSVESLRREVQEIRELLGRSAPGGDWQRPGNGEIAQALIDCGVESALAREIEEAGRRRIPPRGAQRGGSRLASSESACAEAAREIAARFEVAPELGRLVALVGPPGAGKTTTLVKLAVREGIAKGRPVRLISTDTQRIGGAEQLRTYAGILGVPFQAVECGAALAQAIDAAPAPALVLIDTPGYSAAMLEDLGGDLAAFLSRRQDIDIHLVLTASMRLDDLHRTAALYERFQPGKLLFTRLDETSSMAAVFCGAVRSGKPVSFLAAGQSIPEDLEPAAKARIIESLVRQLPTTMEAVA